MFTAKVKADGRFFIGAIELGTHQRDAYALEPDKRYLVRACVGLRAHANTLCGTQHRDLGRVQ